MRKICLLIFNLVCLACLQAQVGINTSTPSVTLDVRPTSVTNIAIPEGVIFSKLPRGALIAKTANGMYTANHAGTMVYVTFINGTVDVATELITKVGFYYFDGTKWQPGENKPQAFYLPPFNLEITSVANGLTYDLYNDVYRNQSARGTKTNWISSNGATQLPVVYQANQLDFVVTSYYAPNCFTATGLSAAGVLSYNVTNVNTNLNAFFMNVMLVPRN